MQLFRARIIQPCKGAKRGRSGDVKYKKYDFNQSISGSISNGSITPDNYVEVFKTPDGYMIPMHCVSIQGPINSNKTAMNEDIQDAVIIEDNNYVDKKSINKASKMMNMTGGIFDTSKKTKSAINGGVYGAAAGLIYALVKGKNKYLFLTIGAVGGYILGTAYHNYIKDDSKSKI